MATFDDMAKQYAELLKRAAERPRTKTASLTESEVRDDPVTNALREIDERLSSLRYEKRNQPLSGDDRDDLLERVGKLLRLSDPELVGRMVKESSNQNFIALARLNAELLAQLGKK